MRQLLVLAAVAGLALARPETYREKEDFQFSRSSTDEGSKSGYYGAQRGNMGGNYERSHNMDNLAQNQMSGLVKTAEGELGDGARQQTGSVFTAANSRGVYGSGHYDLSNLQGRNFQEGVTHEDSQSHSSLASSHGSAYGTSMSQNAGYSGLNQHQRTGYGASQSQLVGYVATGQNPGYRVDQTQNTGYSSAQSNLRHGQYTSGQSYSANQDSMHASHHDRTAQNTGHDTGYYAQAAGYQGQSYGQSNSHDLDGSNGRTGFYSATPVRVIIRPGSPIIVPVVAQTHDASQSAVRFDQNAINSDTEVFQGTDQQVVLKPQTKHYQSAYSYRKEWEKHNIQPVSGVPHTVPALPTVNPYSANSELYEDAQTKASEQSQSSGVAASQTHHSSHSGYSANSATSSQSRYNTHQQTSGAADQSQYRSGYNGIGTYDSAHNRAGAYIGVANGAAVGLPQVDDEALASGLSSKPKGYQSSYSYHKSWERQGDPYVIEPASNGLQGTSGKLVSANQASDSSYQYGSHRHSHQNNNANCDVCRYRREAGSYNTQQMQEHLSQQSQNLEDLGQQFHSTWGGYEDELDRVEDLGQQSVNRWDQPTLGQQTQNTRGNLETLSQTDLGQQTQESWGTLDNKPKGNDESRDHVGMGTVQQLDNPIDISQSTSQLQTITTNKNSTHHHTIWDEIKKEEIGQETEETAEDLTQTADQGQQTQNSWGNINQKENSPWKPENKVLFHMPMPNQPSHPDTYDMPNPHPWMYNQMHHNMHHDDHHDSMNHFFSHDSSSYSGSHSHSWQEHSTNMNSNSYSNGQGSSVVSLWDKLANIEKDTIPSHGKDDTGIYAAQGDTQHVWGTNVFGTQADQKTFESHYNNHGHREVDTLYNRKPTTPQDSRTTTDSPRTEDKPLQHENNFKSDQTATSPNTDKPSTEAITLNVQPLDVGRGDIGPEDTPNEPIESQSKPIKNDKVDSHNVAQQNKDENTDLGVLSLEQQQVNQDKDKVVTSAITTSTERVTEHQTHNENSYNVHEGRDRDMEQFEDQGQYNYEQETNLHQVEDQLNNHQDTDQQFVDFGQQNVNIGAEQMEQQFETEGLSHNNAQGVQKHEGDGLGQQNVPFVDFGQQNENIRGEQVEQQQFETQNFEPIESLHEENKKHSVEEIGQSDDQIDKVSLSGWKADKDSAENRDQQNKQEDQDSISGWKAEQPLAVGTSEENEHVDQISQSEWKSDNPAVNQQNDKFEQVSGWKDENFNQQEHKLQNWGQQENLEQQSQSGWTEDMKKADRTAANQQNDQFEQVSGWKDENSNEQEHKLQNWGQQENLEQQSQSGWTDDMEKADRTAANQQNDQFEQVSGWKDENSNQQEHKLQNWGQQENLEQQSQSEWTEGVVKADKTAINQQNDQFEPVSGWKDENSNQQEHTLQNWGQQENLEQQSQSEWTVGVVKADKTAINQQNDQFEQVSGWKDENSNQQEHKLQNWGQQENLEQQSQSGWTEDIEGQMVQAAWKPTEGLQQHSQSFAENVWVPEDQQVQTVWKPTEDLQQSFVPDTFGQRDQGNSSSQTAQVVEEIIVPKKVAAVDAPPAPTTEKPGFWKSVGNKFTSAKDKVASWFSKDPS